MAFTHLDATRLFGAGEFLELLRLSGFTRALAPSLEARTRIILTHALAFTGQYAVARELVALDVTSQPSLGIRSRAQCILGIIEAAEGNMALASNHFHAAVHLAREALDSEQVAWAYLYLFRLLIDGQPTHAVMGLLPEVRRAVTNAGLPHLTAYLHLSVSALEGNIGRLDEALRHCDTADSILEIAPNAWLEGTALLNRGCIAHMRCEFGIGAQYLERAKQVLARSGHARGTWVLDNNLGHIDTVTGHLKRARQRFDRILASPSVSSFALAAAYEGIARIHLIHGELDQCEAALAQLTRETTQHAGLESTYHARSAGIIKARLYLRNGDPDSALASLSQLEETLEVVRDLPLNAALHLVFAQAYAAKGDLPRAGQRLLVASEQGATEFRDVQAQLYFASSLLAQRHDRALGTHLRERAERLWMYQGTSSMRAQLDDSESGLYAQGQPESAGAATGPALVVDSIAGCIDLAYAPRLLGTELLSLIRELSCSPNASLVEALNTGAPSYSAPQVLTLAIGEDRGHLLTLRCDIPSRPDSAITLANVLRIGRAAVDLERARREERSRAALWPAAPVEEQVGALFLAEEMQALLATIRRIAPTDVPVLITGETGTGKEVLARMVHAYSGRASKTFLPFNCSATPKEMLDSQLFGHRRGSFTGASENFAGVIRAASGGTLFIDEIGEATLEVQPKFLRFLESSEVHPIGETQPIKVDVRVIAATNADLDTMLSQGRFREDLFYRLNIVRLHIPPLRERRVEVPALANHYLRKHAHECRKGDLRLAEETMEYLVLYRWPGNVRQLANEMRRLAVMAEPGAVLMPEHLSPDIAASRKTVPASQRVLESTEMVVRLDQPMAAAVQHVERALLQYALKACHGRIEETATRLGLSRKGLYLKRQRYGLEAPGSHAAGVA